MLYSNIFNIREGRAITKVQEVMLVSIKTAQNRFGFRLRVGLKKTIEKADCCL